MKEIFKEYRYAMEQIDILENKGFKMNEDYIRLLKNDFILISKNNRLGYNKIYVAFINHEKAEGHVAFSFRYRNNRRPDSQYSFLRAREDSLKGSIIKAIVNHKAEELEMLQGVILDSKDI